MSSLGGPETVQWPTAATLDPSERLTALGGWARGGRSAKGAFRFPRVPCWNEEEMQRGVHLGNGTGTVGSQQQGVGRGVTATRGPRAWSAGAWWPWGRLSRGRHSHPCRA